jgi:acid phosphatase class B
VETISISSPGGKGRCQQPTRSRDRLERMFGVHLPHPIVQTDLKDKTPFIAKRHIIYYYGDSDSDITAAVGAKAVPIRVATIAGILC